MLVAVVGTLGVFVVGTMIAHFGLADVLPLPSQLGWVASYVAWNAVAIMVTAFGVRERRNGAELVACTKPLRLGMAPWN